MINTRFDPFPVLRSARVVLRAVALQDEQAVYFLRSDPGVMKYTGQPLAASVGEARDYIRLQEEKRAAGDGILWAISPANDEQLVGLIGYRKFIKEHFRGEIGYGLHPASQGKGLMQEALELVVDFGFNYIGLHSIEANVDKANLASIRLLERNGFVREAHFRENYYFEGKFIDSVIYSLVHNPHMGPDAAPAD